MDGHQTTVDESRRDEKEGPSPRPGLVLIYSIERPAAQAFPIGEEPLELGRSLLADDERASRQHARVAFADGRWRVADLESRNGTFVDGARVSGEAVLDAPKVLRIGRSVLLFEHDVRKFEPPELGVEIRDGLLLGPKLKATYARIERSAQFGDTLFIRGESGSGKELAAHAFHAYGGREKEPFVAVNCAAIPEGVAERLLFGAKRGAYSGATSDAEGYVQAADGGTLFLDEVAELDLAVQAKLLRVLETKQVIALGEATPRQIRIRVCSATHRDLRETVAAGKFREDLYFRIGRPEVQVPPLRDRLEEIPWHIARELERLATGQVVRVGFVEACLLRRWPGNIRELTTEVRRAAQEASLEDREALEAGDLAVDAGAGFASAAQQQPAEVDPPTGAGAGEVATRPRGVTPPRAEIEEALRIERGNVTRAARRLGMHRNQLRRWLEKNEVPADLLSPDSD